MENRGKRVNMNKTMVIIIVGNSRSRDLRISCLHSYRISNRIGR